MWELAETNQHHHVLEWLAEVGAPRSVQDEDEDEEEWEDEGEWDGEGDSSDDDEVM